MVAALVKAVRNLGDRELQGMLVRIAGWSAGVYLVVLALLFWGLDAALLGAWAERQLGWLPSWLVEAAVVLLAVFAFVALFWFTFVVVAQCVAGFYLDRVVARVEETDYPRLGAAPGAGMAREAATLLRFTAALLALNLVALPFYVLGLVIPPVSIAIFYIVNGYLLGREYAEAVLSRRLSPSQVRRWRREHAIGVWCAGAVIALGMSVPVVNFAAPVVAAAFMTHICHGRRPKGGAAVAP